MIFWALTLPATIDHLVRDEPHQLNLIGSEYIESLIETSDG